MDWQTGLNIFLALLAGYLGIRNFQMSQRREDRQESRDMTEVRVQLQNVMSMLQDLQKDIRTNNEDYRRLAERVVVIETEMKTAFKRIDELKGKVNHE